MNKKLKLKNVVYFILVCIIILLVFLYLKQNLVNNKEVVVFFRNDDVGELTIELISLTEIFIKENVPLNLEVVPKELSNETIIWLKELKEKYPNSIQIDQHGWSHVPYICKEVKSSTGEFGKCRSYEEEYEDILKGKNKLIQEFGSDFSLVFTPPLNDFDEDTLASLQNLGFNIISGYRSPKFDRIVLDYIGIILKKDRLFGRIISYHGKEYNKYNITELSVCIDLYHVLTKDEFIKEFKSCEKRDNIIGIMIHHWAFDNKEKLDMLHEAIKELKNNKNIEFKTFDQIYNNQKK